MQLCIMCKYACSADAGVITIKMAANLLGSTVVGPM